MLCWISARPFLLFIRLRKEEDGGWVLILGESSWRDMSVVMMSLSQYISHCYKAPLPRAIAWWRASIGADDLILSRQFFRGWGLFFEIRPSLHFGCTRKEERESSLVKCACEFPLISKPGWLLQNNKVEKCYFLLLGCFIGVRLVGRHCLALEGILGVCHGEQCWS